MPPPVSPMVARPSSASEHDVYTIVPWSASVPGQMMPDEINLVIAQTSTFPPRELGRLEQDDDRTSALDYAEEVFGPKGRTSRTYLNLNRGPSIPSLIVFPELAFSCAQLCATPTASGNGGLAGLIARDIESDPTQSCASGGDLVVFAGGGHNSGRMLALTIVATALQLASFLRPERRRPQTNKLRELFEEAVQNSAQRDRLLAKADLKTRKRQLCVIAVRMYFRAPDKVRAAGRSPRLASQIVITALGLHSLRPGEQIENDPFAHGSDDEWHGSGILSELRYNFAFSFFTEMGVDPYSKLKKRSCLFSVFFKRRPMQNFEKRKVPLFGNTYRHPLFKVGDFTFVPMICFDFIDDSRDSSREVLRRYLESGAYEARSRIIVVVMSLNGEPSQETWWNRIDDMIESIEARQVTLVFAQTGYDDETITTFLGENWDDRRADVFRNLSGVYRHALGATFRDAGGKHVQTLMSSLHAKTQLWRSVWAAAVRYLEPCLVAGTLSFRLSGEGNRQIWDAQRALMFRRGREPWTPDPDFEEITLQVTGWLFSRRMPVSLSARAALRRMAEDLRHQPERGQALSTALLSQLLWGGRRAPRPLPWSGGFVLPDPVGRDDLYGVSDDWAPVALTFIYLFHQLDAEWSQPRRGSTAVALLIPRPGKKPSRDEPIVVWRPPPSVDTLKDADMEAALTGFLSGFHQQVRRVTIIVVGEYRLGFAPHNAARFVGGQFLRMIANGAAFEYAHWIPRRMHPGPPAAVLRGWPALYRLGLDPSYGRLRVRIVGNSAIVGLIRFEDDGRRSEAKLLDILR